VRDINKPVSGRRAGVVPVLVLLLVAAGCQYAPKCLEPYNVLLHARFVTQDGSREKDTLLVNADIYGIGREDTLLTSGKESFSKIDFPMDPNRDSCRFAFRYNGLTDTLLFLYDRSVRLLSYECGFIMEYGNLQVEYTMHQIDSVAVTDSLVSNTDDENIKIYLFRH